MRRIWIVALAALAVLSGLYMYQQHVTHELKTARQAATDANKQMVVALRFADQKVAAGAVKAIAADKIEQHRAALAPARAAVVKAAPDTCTPAIAALQAENAELKQELALRKGAYQDQKEATGALIAAAKPTVAASQNLVKATGGFWKAVTPHFGVGAAAGISAVDRKPDLVIGVTLSWGR